MNLRFSADAVKDLTRVRKFIEEKNPAAVSRIARDLLLGLEKLRVFPEIGIKVERAFEPQRIRDLYVGSYTVRYLVGDGEVVILRVWHGKEGAKDL